MSVPSHAWVHSLFILFPQTLILATDLNCTYNTRGILFCSWNTNNQYSSAPCNISAKAKDTSRDISGSCTLSLHENPRHCAVRLTYNGKYDNNPLTVGHEVNTSVVCNNAQTIKIVKNTVFSPYDHVRLDPPESLNIKMTEDGNWNLTWLVFSNRIFNMETEVLYKPLEMPWQDEIKLLLWEKELSVLLRGLKPGTFYEAMVRVKAKNDIDEPGALWSYWSQRVEWKTPSKDTDSHVTIVTPLTVAISVVAFFLIMLIIFNQKRVKKIIWIGVPDPSSFFDPLMSDYKGNFQKWLSSPFTFSSFSPDPCPPDISRLDVNWNKEEHRPKSLCDHTHETQSDKSIQCVSSVSNKGYFTTNCLCYDHVDHQGFQTIESRESLSSPTEDMPLCYADYLCAPLSIAGLGFHNKSFELDFPQRNMQLPILVEEVMHNVDNHDTCSSTLSVSEEIIQQEENEDFIESPGACSTAALVFHEVQPASHTFDSSAGYLSLNELYQKHAAHWK